MVARNDSLKVDKERFPKLGAKPQPKPSDLERYCGFTVKNLPLALTDENIVKFLVESGTPEDASKSKLNIVRGPKTISVTAEGIEPHDVIKIVETIDFPQARRKFFNVPLYCRPLRIQTPIKSKTPDPSVTTPTAPPKPFPTKQLTDQAKKPSPTHIVGGVSFRDTTEKLEGFVFNDDDVKQNPSMKRNALNRSPLDSIRDSKLVKM